MCHLHSTGNGTYLVTGASLHDYWETVVIGGRGAEDVHYGAHLLHSVEACDWRAHDFSIGKEHENIIGLVYCLCLRVIILTVG